MPLHFRLTKPTYQNTIHGIRTADQEQRPFNETRLTHNTGPTTSEAHTRIHASRAATTSILCWVVQWSWFARANALCNLSRKKSREVALLLPGRFLSRRRFTLCITMKAKPWIAMHCCSCKIYRGKGMEDGEIVSLCRFLVDQKIVSSWKIDILGHPIARATSYCLLPDTFWQQASKNVFKIGSVIFVHCHRLPLWRKYAPEVKTAKGLKQCWAKVKGVNNSTWTAQ